MRRSTAIVSPWAHLHNCASVQKYMCVQYVRECDSGLLWHRRCLCNCNILLNRLHLTPDSARTKKVTFTSNRLQACIMQTLSLSLLVFDLRPRTLAYSTHNSSRLILMVFFKWNSQPWVKSRAHWTYLADYWTAQNSSWWTYNSSEASTIHNARTYTCSPLKHSSQPVFVFHVDVTGDANNANSYWDRQCFIKIPNGDADSLIWGCDELWKMRISSLIYACVRGAISLWMFNSSLKNRLFWQWSSIVTVFVQYMP